MTKPALSATALVTRPLVEMFKNLGVADAAVVGPVRLIVGYEEALEAKGAKTLAEPPYEILTVAEGFELLVKLGIVTSRTRFIEIFGVPYTFNCCVENEYEFIVKLLLLNVVVPLTANTPFVEMPNCIEQSPSTIKEAIETDFPTGADIVAFPTIFRL